MFALCGAGKEKSKGLSVRVLIINDAFQSALVLKFEQAQYNILTLRSGPSVNPRTASKVVYTTLEFTGDLGAVTKNNRIVADIGNLPDFVYRNVLLSSSQSVSFYF